VRGAGLALLLAAALVAGACSGKDASLQPEAPTPAPAQAPPAEGLVGKPLDRTGIGDVELSFDRYANTQAALIDLYKAQPWFQDGLTRDEALFVERGLSFTGRYDGPVSAQISRTTIEDKLYKYDKVSLSQGEVELLLIYEPGQDAAAEMATVKQLVPVLESLVGVQFPEKVLTIVNGSFAINDFRDGQFIRIDRCCVNSPFILAHELAHTYWSMASGWFIEGMADLYANFALIELNKEAPPGWRQTPVDLESYYATRRKALDSGRYPDLLLPLRLASDGLYEVADVFLLDVRREIGAENFAEAARDIYLTSDFGRYILNDKRLEDAFLRHTPAAKRDAVMGLFNQSIWGDNGERYQRMLEQDGP
jgi:hypothetical protein